MVMTDTQKNSRKHTHQCKTTVVKYFHCSAQNLKIWFSWRTWVVLSSILCSNLFMIEMELGLECTKSIFYTQRQLNKSTVLIFNHVFWLLLLLLLLLHTISVCAMLKKNMGNTDYLDLITQAIFTLKDDSVIVLYTMSCIYSAGILFKQKLNI